MGSLAYLLWDGSVCAAGVLHAGYLLKNPQRVREQGSVNTCMVSKAAWLYDSFNKPERALHCKLRALDMHSHRGLVQSLLRITTRTSWGKLTLRTILGAAGCHWNRSDM